MMEIKEGSIILDATINKERVRILVDLGANKNYIDEEFVRKHQIPYKQTTEWVEVIGADGNTISEGYKKRIGNVKVRSDNYQSDISFDLAPLNSDCYDAIVGMEWLKKVNPVIDWTNGTITVDKQELRTNPEIRRIAEVHKKIDYGIKPKPREIYEKELAEVLAKLSKKYHNYIELFVKKEYRIPTYPPEYEATIKLKPGAKLTQVKQRQKLRDEQEAEDKFIDTFYPVEYLQESSSSNSSQNIYVPKKDGIK
ncbi:hypothetical protein PISL3812_05136 [Talaromyces islandicus]|uniref:Peptidase A2 domain-containing protein n=1 Tax=Talaromyces islandicus TaxID=28573 RepID=A0A0U1LXL0_TALIS|nr:hypothetical protein PISL3812_05136 [Talaromyces islandicus]